jgi:hypothetical protein
VGISESRATTAVDGPASPEKVSIGRQAIRREINDRIRARHDGDQEEFEVFCECGRAICGDAAYVTADLYDKLRRVPTHFLISYSHRGQSERIVESHEDFAVVEKFGSAGLEAIRFDRAIRARPGGSIMGRSTHDG